MRRLIQNTHLGEAHAHARPRGGSGGTRGAGTHLPPSSPPSLSLSPGRAGMCRAAAAVCQALQVPGELGPLQGGNISNASWDGDGGETARPKCAGGDTACPRPAPSAPPSQTIRTLLKPKFTLVWVGCLKHPRNREPWMPLDVPLLSYPTLSSLCAPMGALDHLC